MIDDDERVGERVGELVSSLYGCERTVDGICSGTYVRQKNIERWKLCMYVTICCLK